MTELVQSQINSILSAISTARQIDRYVETANVVEQRVKDAFPAITDWEVRGRAPRRLSEFSAVSVGSVRALNRAITDYDPRTDRSAIALIASMVKL